MRNDFLNLIRYYPAQFIAILTLLVSSLVATDLIPALRGITGEWQWSHNTLDLITWRLIFPIIIAFILYQLANPNTKRSISNIKLLIFALFAVALRFSIQFTTANNFSLIARTLNPTYFGYFPPAVTIADLPNFLREFTTTQTQLPYYRLTTHPPGGVIFHWLIIQLVKIFPTQFLEPLITPRLASLPSWINTYSTQDIIAGATASFAIPLLSALSVIPLYHLTRLLWEEHTARLTTLLYTFIPALTLFTPVFDDLFTLITSLTLYFVVSGIIRQHRWHILIAGLIWGIGTFASFGLLPLMLIAAIYVFLSAISERLVVKNFVFNSAALAIGGITVWAAMWIIFGLNPFIIYSHSMNEHAILTTNRSYWVWLIYNPYDLLLFAGIPIAIHFIASFKELLNIKNFTGLTVSNQLLISFLFTGLLVLVSGNVRGETARILLYVQPIIALFAANHIAQFSSRITFYTPLLLTLILVQTIIFQTTLNVYH